jgi:hypothetical protein
VTGKDTNDIAFIMKEERGRSPSSSIRPIRSRSISVSRSVSSRASHSSISSSRKRRLEPGEDVTVLAFRMAKSKSFEGSNQCSSSVKARVRQARKQSSKDFKEPSKYQYLVEEGYISYRFFTFLCGFMMIITSCTDYFGPYSNVDYPESLASLIVLCTFALLILQLEGRLYGLQIQPLYRLFIVVFSPLERARVRGILYFLIGTFQYCQLTWFNMICGVILILLGLLWILFDLRAALRLTSLRLFMNCKGDVKFVFNGFDDDRDGYLDCYEFRRMLQAFGELADYNLLVAVFAIIDVQNMGMISCADLLRWYESFDEREMMGCGEKCYSWKSDRREVDDKNLHLLV